MIERLIQHVVTTGFQDLPGSAVEAAKTFIFDSVGVGVSGSNMPLVDAVKQAVTQWGTGQQAQVWATGEWLPAASAALINGYQIHNQEWDCVHEKAVVHPMATILSALMAVGQNARVSGQQLILGTAIAVDIATLIGGSVTSGLRFFRPGVCGCLGATAGICSMLQLSEEVTSNAMGIAYSQLSGTMQAHVEGSPMLAMQIGFNATAAVRSVDMAMAGFSGPKDILEGPFGYFNLFEDDYLLDFMETRLGKQYQVEQISHKPFPTGRAGHGTVDGLCCLKEEFQFDPEQVEQIVVSAPPLINRLVGRPATDDMTASYAKLCNGYIAACALYQGSVSVDDFAPAKLTDVKRLALAQKVVTQVNDIEDPNALAPIDVEVRLRDGRHLRKTLPHVLGHPERPMSVAMQQRKFKEACGSAKVAFSEQQICKLINGIEGLEQIPDINQLVNLMVVNQE